MRNIIRYIFKTLSCHISKNFLISNSKIKWIVYKVVPTTTIEIQDSSLYHSAFNDYGVNNKIVVKNAANLSYSNIIVEGEDNSVTLDGCIGGVTIIIKGKNCNVYIGPKTSMESLYIVCKGPNDAVTIGKDCMFSGNVEIWGSDTHRITDLDNQPLNFSLPVNIGNHVWVGKHAKILKGTSIGDNSIIGMCSVVTHDVPNNSAVAGNPSKVVKNGVTWHRGYIGI